ncbi:hypothetical protein [Moheibacter sediminis]|uniref:LTXXQ motif family protein n=1 Tax=Moheibacter sediminis TaxID=1434700 RepID=A0A1W2C102_9FLAO|nr:hypothetical protein [Moheibacter sediminis]SMC78905.1 hypothetical protein SAMN06296427_10852 [Moheibacter sediminis]
MKKLFLLVAVFAFVGISSAQEKSKTKESSAVKVDKKNNLDEWSKELNLTEAQKVQVQKINDDYKTKKQAIRANGTATDFKKLNDEKQAAIDAVLTPEQRAKQDKLHQQKVDEKNKKADLKASK